LGRYGHPGIMRGHIEGWQSVPVMRDALLI